MASRSCVEEVNRLRQEFRPDLPQYKLPAGKTKLKLAGALVPISPKTPRREPSKRQQKVPKKSSQNPHNQNVGQSERNLVITSHPQRSLGKPPNYSQNLTVVKEILVPMPIVIVTTINWTLMVRKGPVNYLT